MVKILKWIGAIVIASLIASFGVKQLFEHDGYRGRLESYISADQKVSDLIGRVNKIVIVSRTIYSGSKGDRDYRQYTCNISGDRGKAVVIIRLYPKSSGREEQYEVWGLKLQS